MQPVAFSNCCSVVTWNDLLLICMLRVDIYDMPSPTIKLIKVILYSIAYNRQLTRTGSLRCKTGTRNCYVVK